MAALLALGLLIGARIGAGVPSGEAIHEALLIRGLLAGREHLDQFCGSDLRSAIWAAVIVHVRGRCEWACWRGCRHGLLQRCGLGFPSRVRRVLDLAGELSLTFEGVFEPVPCLPVGVELGPFTPALATLRERNAGFFVEPITMLEADLAFVDGLIASATGPARQRETDQSSEPVMKSNAAGSVMRANNEIGRGHAVISVRWSRDGRKDEFPVAGGSW